MREAVKDLVAQLFQATQSLAEYKHRALTAEVCNPSLLSHAIVTLKLVGAGRVPK